MSAAAMQKVEAKPILFTGGMVRAILEGRKTQTRRVVSDQKRFPHLFQGSVRFNGMKRGVDYLRYKNIDVAEFTTDCSKDCLGNDFKFWSICPYGKVGGHLWVRETWRAVEREVDAVDGILYAADEAFIPIENTPQAAEAWVIANDNGRHGDNWRPSIFMPRWASRLTLEITDIRVERLQDITGGDAWEEGFRAPFDVGTYFHSEERMELFSKGWDAINGKRGYTWESNPYVWAITFKPISENGFNPIPSALQRTEQHTTL